MQEGSPPEGGLLVTVNRRRKVVRLAFDAPHTYGRRGARWYAGHHALACSLSRAAGATVHAYVFDPEEYEEVIAYGNGRRVGGERVVYEDVELPEELVVGQGAEDGAQEQAFERLRARWPLGHLAYVFGLTRDELLRLPRAEGVLLPLEGTADAAAALGQLLAVPAVRGMDSGSSAAYRSRSSCGSCAATSARTRSLRKYCASNR